jgi:hypothetical protein
MRADRPLETKQEYDRQVKEAPEDKNEALSYWVEQCAFWLYQIHSQNAILMRRDEVRQRYAKLKSENKPRSGKESWYCIELIPSYPANIPIEMIRRSKPKEGEPFHIQRAMNVKEAKQLIEARLNAARARNPEAMPGTINEEDQDAGQEI